MMNNDYLNILYFTLILIAFLPFLKKIGFKKGFEYASMWVLIFLIIGIAYMFRGSFSAYSDKFIGELIPGSVRVESEYFVINRNNDGHYYINININGYSHKALVDTGASEVMIPFQYARQAGIKISGVAKSFQTANGIAEAYLGSTDISLGGITFNNFPVYIQSVEPGVFLIGMSFLQRFSEFKFEDDKLYLKP